jgi:hypothetical protein
MTSYTVTKISEYTNLDEVPADDDELILVDTSESATKANNAGYLRRSEVNEVTSSGAQSGAASSKYHLALNHASAINFTITGAPTAGDELTIIVDTTASHTVILSGSVTWDGTNQTANLGTDGNSLRAVARSATRWDVISFNGVTFSA